MSNDDPFDSEEWQQYADRILRELVPMIRDSAVSISIVPKGESDVKFAVELGFCIMMDKPIIAVVQPGSKVPAKLVAVADEIIEAPDEMSQEWFTLRLAPVLKRLGGGS